MKNLWKSGLALLLALAFVIPQGAALAADEEESTPSSTVSGEIENYLKGFGIFDESEVIDNTAVTRADAVNYFVKAAGFDFSLIGGETQTFTDVSKGSTAWKASEAGSILGIINVTDDRLFHPTREVSQNEAVTMAVRTMRCEAIANLRGGYPNGYLEVARDSYLLNGTSGSETVTKADIAAIVYNMHKAQKYDITYDGDRISYSKNSEVTVAEDLLGVKRYRVNFVNTNSSEKTAEIKFLSGDKKGVTEKYNVSDKVNLAKLGGSGYVYINDDDDEIVYVEIKKGSDVKYDFISEINNYETVTDLRVKDIKKITLANENKTYDVSEDLAVYYNDKKVEDEAYSYVNCFAKTVVQDDEIIRMDIYPLSAGGLVLYSVIEQLRFSVDSDDIIWYDMDKLASIEVYLDGMPVDNLLSLRENYIFDYWYDKDEDKMIIVASSRAVYGTLTGYTDGKITVEGQKYDVADNWCDFNIKGNEYRKGEGFSDLLGQKVTVYFDDNMKARFIHIDTVNTHTDKVKGVITSAYEEKGTGDKYIKVFHIDDNLGEIEYKVADKLKSSSMSFAYAQSVQKDLDGNGFLEFTLNGSGEIKSIDPVEYFGYSTNVSSGIDDKNTMGGQYIVEAQWFALLDLNGEFTVRKLTYNRMKYMKPNSTGKFLSDYNPRYNSIPKYVMLLGFEDAVTVFTTTSVINDIEYVDDDHSKLVLANNNNYTAENRFISENGLKEGMLITYRVGWTGKDPFKVEKKMDLSDESSTWATDTFTPDAGEGFYRADDLFYRNDYVVQFIVNGDVTDTFIFPDDGGTTGKGPVAYKHNRNSFDIVYMNFGGEASYVREYRGAMTMNLRKGDNIWFHLNDKRQVDWFIFEGGPNSFEK